MSKKQVIRTVVLGLLVAKAQIPTARADFMFGPQMDLGPTVNSPHNEANPVISRNGLELYFYSSRPGGYGSGDVLVCKRASVADPWGPAENLGPWINSTGVEWPESISSDGLTLHITVWTSATDADMYTATRPTIDAPWGPRVKMGPLLNNASDLGGTISPDDLELHFPSNRAGGMGGYDIWVSTRATRNDPWGPPVNLGPTINTTSNDSPASISPDGLILFIITDRPGGFGGSDTLMARRPSQGAAWSEPVNLGPSFNTPDSDDLTCVSADGRWAYCDMAADMWMAPIIPIVDFNGDGIVDAADVCIMIDYWGENYSLCDIGPMPWGDGVVDVKDLVVLAEHLFEEPYDPSLIAHYKLDETEGFIAADSAGENDGTLSGGSLWQPEGGQVGGALQLNGVDDCVIAPFNFNPADGPFSVFSWVKDGVPGQVILSQAGAANWLMADSADGALRTDLKEPATTGRDPKPPGPSLISSTVVTDGNWHRVGFVRDNINRILYVDDVEVARDTAVNLEAAGGGLYIGAGSGLESGTFWSGLIDDVRIYNRVVRP